MAIVKHFARLVPEKHLLGKSVLEGAIIEMWLHRTFTQVKPSADFVTGAIFGQTMFEDEYSTALQTLKSLLMSFNKHLTENKWLVGDSLTIADVALAGLLAHPFQCMLDAGSIKRLDKLMAWFNNISTQKFFMIGFGLIHVNDKPMKPLYLVKRALPKAKVQPKQEEKKGEKKEGEKKEKKLSKADRVKAK